MDKTTMERKRQLPEFKDLFNALFKLRDHDIQYRVLDAINGIIKDSCDCLCCKKELIDVGTQTEYVPSIKMENLRSNSIDSGVIDNSSIVYSDSNNGPDAKRKKRSRKVPRVEKSVKEAAPFLAKPIRFTEEESQKILASTSSLNWIKEFEDFDMISEPPVTITEPTSKDIIEFMKKEFVTSLKSVGGLLPLHKAIHENNYKFLKRQLYVLEFRKKDLNDLCTADNQCPLQYALTADSSTRIVEELIMRGVSVHKIDKDGNTVLHLVMLYSTNTNILKLLLDKLDLSLILETNDDGMTCLHIGVRENKFQMCKFLLEYIDDKLGFVTVGKKESDEKALKDLYLKSLGKFVTKKPMKLNSLKMKLLNQTDIKLRRTALFYSLNLESKLIMFMLLCHVADPTISEHSGQDCIAYSDSLEQFSPQIKCALRNTAAYLEKCKKVQFNTIN